MNADASQQAWETRAARNQSLFRAINDELRATPAAGAEERFSIACECADVACVETIELEVAEYRRIRQKPTHFAVLAGHVYLDVERVIRESTGYVVVEKTGTAARVAAASDGTSDRG